MGPAANHLGRTKVAQLLAAIGTTPVPESGPEATPYDWRAPHSLTTDQHNRLMQALEQTATRMTEVFTRARSGNVKVALKSFTQHFAAEVCRRLDMEEDFSLAFGPTGGQSCGFVAITPQAASAWVTWLLGDSDSGRDPGRALSALEESLLADLLAGVLNVFLALLRTPRNSGPSSAAERTGETLKSMGSLGRGQPDLQFELTEEIAHISFEVAITDQGEPSAVAFLLPCSRLAGLAGKTSSSEASKASPAELSRALLEHLQDMPVTVTAVLASTTLTFQEVLELSPGDILLLDKPVEAPAQLAVDKRTILHGRPARSAGKHALVIVQDL